MHRVHLKKIKKSNYSESLVKINQYAHWLVEFECWWTGCMRNRGPDRTCCHAYPPSGICQSRKFGWTEIKASQKLTRLLSIQWMKLARPLHFDWPGEILRFKYIIREFRENSAFLKRKKSWNEFCKSICYLQNILRYLLEFVDFSRKEVLKFSRESPTYKFGSQNKKHMRRVEI